MSQRIRYVKTSEEGILKSLRGFQTKTSTFVVFLDVINKKFKIEDLDGKIDTISGGNTKNLNLLKKQAKDALIAMGINFKSEMRHPKTYKNKTIEGDVDVQG